ncbi:long-chain fatty acid--CoA ligase [Aestuariivirga litoralis]|uniref:3-methylmercaptopropionyl-CoA ligase n=1 Tax=Aestuariivirga litoralis TaxID=2650924 RepID=A0A2W2AQD2_9HYPH|nr:long-chain-fatty-acid--CoA ligase [Aestuariivirga litoralis]PZF75812.1 long-chain fatty acid--CoA ligase [Aestuariivirga litoralis]
MLGLMQEFPLLVHRVLDHAARWHGTRPILSRSVEGPLHRTDYATVSRRARALASACERQLGLSLGSVIATMAWNTWRHLEIWYGVMGMGGIVHTLNPRLFTDQLGYIVNHAEDQWIFTDLTFVPLLEKLQDQCPKVKGFVILSDEAHMPETTLRNVVCYETLIAEGDADYAWPEFDENTACGMCYTSGTTGHPKGVLYSHRSNVLHGLMCALGDAMAIKSVDVAMPVVPMFHANAWSLAFSAPIGGAALVLPGPKLDGASIYEMLTEGKVTITAAVPTVWLMLLAYLEQNPELRLPHLDRVVIGGSACPESIMKAFVETYGSDVIHAWGMTEMSPIGSLAVATGETRALPSNDWWTVKLKQGRPPFMVDMKITDDEGNPLPHDGKTFGRLKVKGPAVARCYYKGEGSSAFDAEGWFDTGDVATIDAYGFMQITDRAKDVIKSGGEWISSIDLENIALGCPGVHEAAAIGLPHPRWDERPLLVVVKKQEVEVTAAQVLAHLDGKVAKWWMPDDVAFVDEIPHTATGKISKLELRARFKGYRFPGV